MLEQCQQFTMSDQFQSVEARSAHWSSHVYACDTEPTQWQRPRNSAMNLDLAPYSTPDLLLLTGDLS